MASEWFNVNTNNYSFLAWAFVVAGCDFIQARVAYHQPPMKWRDFIVGGISGGWPTWPLVPVLSKCFLVVNDQINYCVRLVQDVSCCGCVLWLSCGCVQRFQLTPTLSDTLSSAVLRQNWSVRSYMSSTYWWRGWGVVGGGVKGDC